MHTPEPSINTAALVQLAAVKGQLETITLMMGNHHDATHQRINDMQRFNETRFDGIDGRIGTLEKNERDTALRTASIASLAGAVSSAIVAAGMAMLKIPPR